MLKLKNIKKDYVAGDSKVEALKGINITFRKSEFVAILGPSGCGKTTLLNIVGGLDRYTDGDMIINNISTKKYKDPDWDAYRNKSIGFVFQNYNLIPHLTVLGNVELALTLSGVSVKERREKAEEALAKVGLANQTKKRPNQLSGGQMQRVAIARALVNNPEIILADEPTGALDSVTSVQISDLLKEISKERLIIMVTHNDELAKKYATRTIRLLDGEMIGDSNPFTEETSNLGLASAPAEKTEKETPKKEPILFSEPKIKSTGKKPKKNKTSMSFFTAMSLSFKNLITKKTRTFMTAFAGSIGIIGIALVLAISNGFTLYINKMQSDTLSGYPISISTSAMNMDMSHEGGSKDEIKEFPKGDEINIYTPQPKITHINNITQEYVDYVYGLDKAHINGISLARKVKMNIVSKVNDKYILVESQTNDMMEMMGASSTFLQELLDNQEFMDTQYDVLTGEYPTEHNEIALVVDKYNRISSTLLASMGLNFTDAESIKFSDLLGYEYKLVGNDDFYTLTGDKFVANAVDKTMYNTANNTSLKITAIMRVNKDAPMELYSSGLLYTPKLTDFVLENAEKSQVAVAQKANKDVNVITGETFKGFVSPIPVIPSKTKEQQYTEAVQNTGASSIPSSIKVFPKDFNSKTKVKAYLEKWNDGKEKADTIQVTDPAEILTTTMTTMVDLITYALVAFAGVSLVVSSIMIGIITYVSVIERTKEIGVLRSIGARKKDISRVFNAETLLIGFTAGAIGVLISFILCFPINAILGVLVKGIGNMAIMHPLHALALVLVSMALTFISGLIPSKIAAKKDPVVALRTE